jgi:hypothetical protein
MSETAPWTCPTCNSTVSTPYCPECGERPLRERELTLRGIFNQVIQTFIKIDGRLIRSFRCLVGRPGLLTVAYLRGQRKPYVGPIPLFLIANGVQWARPSVRIPDACPNSPPLEQLPPDTEAASRSSAGYK